MVSPREHTAFFKAIGKRSSINQALAWSDWLQKEAKQLSAADWDMALKGQGVAQAPVKREDKCSKSFRRWLATQAAEEDLSEAAD